MQSADVDSILERYDTTTNVLQRVKTSQMFKYWEEFMKERGFSVNSARSNSLAHFLIDKSNLANFDELVKTHELAIEAGILPYWKEVVSALRFGNHHWLNRLIAKFAVDNADADDWKADAAAVNFAKDFLQIEHRDHPFSNDGDINIGDVFNFVFISSEFTRKKFPYSGLYKKFFMNLLSSPKLVQAVAANLNAGDLYDPLFQCVPVMSFGAFQKIAPRLNLKTPCDELYKKYQDFLLSACFYCDGDDIKESDLESRKHPLNEAGKYIGSGLSTIALGGLAISPMSEVLCNDVLENIFNYLHAYQVLFVLPLVSKKFKSVVQRDYIVNRSKSFERFLMNISNRKDPVRLYCFWFMNRLFPSVHDLVHHRHKQSPETLPLSWKKMIVKGSARNYDYPLEVVQSCPKKNSLA
jgi:hypothetical protein